MVRADFNKAKELYPSTQMGEAEWVEVFDRNPDIMWAIVADIYNVVKDQEDRDAGVRRVGRRPGRVASSMEDVFNTVFPQQYTTDPFPEAFRKLLGERSQRQFAMKIPCNQATVSRMLSGEVKPDLIMLERVAAAAKVNPAYFLEYRAMFIGQLVTQIFTERPHLGITAVKRVKAGRRATNDD